MAKLKILPGVLDIEILRGATFDATFTLREKNPDGTLGALINLTPYTSAKAQFRPDAESETITDELTTTTLPPTPPPLAANTRAGAIVLGGAAGTIRMVTPRALLLSGYPDETVWDIALYDASGAAWYPLGGSFSITDGVTE